MNTLTVLLLSTLICAGSTQSSGTSSTTTRPLSLSGFLSDIESGIITVPADIVRGIRNQVRSIIETFLNMMGVFTEPLIQNIDSSIDQLCSLASPTSNSGRRRRDLLGLIPSNVRQLIPSNLTYLIEHPVNASTGEMRELANTTVQLLEQLLLNEGLPWLRYTLDKMNNTHLLPTFLSSLISRFDVMYGAMELLGYVRS
ncbi:unnamed protein product [Xylocopa violacea]|uniref:Uncharacterized protein n=1 Tax=Xylocopa violacea TaxID=135666 RepID=A0ABP1NBI1_XYLVO